MDDSPRHYVIAWAGPKLAAKFDPDKLYRKEQPTSGRAIATAKRASEEGFEAAAVTVVQRAGWAEQRLLWCGPEIHKALTGEQA